MTFRSNRSMTNFKYRNKNYSTGFSTFKIKTSVRDFLKEKMRVNVKCINSKIPLNEKKKIIVPLFFNLENNLKEGLKKIRRAS